MKRWLLATLILLLGATFYASPQDAQTYSVHLKSRVFVPPEDRTTALSGLSASAAPGRVHLLFQFYATPSEAQRKALQSLGVELFQYLHNFTYYAAVPMDLSPSSSALAPVRWIGTIYPEDKLDPRILAGQFEPWNLDPDGNATVIVHFHRDIDLANAHSLLQTSGAIDLGEIRSLNAIVARIPSADLPALASEDSVFWVELGLPPPSLTNDGARQAVEADPIQPAFSSGELCGTGIDENCDGLVDEAGCLSPADRAYNLTGSGVKILNYESDPTSNAGMGDLSHPDFGSSCRLIVPPGELGRFMSHATHTSGTILGNGSRSATDGTGAECGQYRGLAPGAGIVSMLNGNDGPPLTLPDLPEMEQDWSEAINLFGTSVSSNSWGPGPRCDLVGNYDSASALVDEIVKGSLGVPHASVWSAGNERLLGCSCPIPPCGAIRSTACAKNAISVGAVYSNTLSVWSGSSPGPCDDGRIKPDLVAPGCEEPAGSTPSGSIWSTRETGQHENFIGAPYGASCGTSMASPVVAGSLALLVEDLKKQFASGLDPLPSTLKALLIHEARLLPATTFDVGWGLLQSKKSIDKVRTKWWQERDIPEGQTHTFQVVLPPGAPELRVTVVWDDEPGTPSGSGPALVNNLDLRLTNPDNVVDRSSTDAVENVIRIVRSAETFPPENFKPGTWKVEVIGARIPVGSQRYSIVFSPPYVDRAGYGSVAAERGFSQCSDVLPIRVIDSDLAGASQVTVTARSTTQSSPVGVPLSKDANNASLFRGSVVTGPKNSRAPLKVSNGDTITITYVDANDGFGNLNVSKTHTAQVECSTPLVSNVRASFISKDEATISWDTSEPATTTVRFSGAGTSQTVSERFLEKTHSVTLRNLQSCTQYSYEVSSADEAGNTATDNNGGLLYSFFTRDNLATIFEDDFETDKGWVASGDDGNPSTPAGVSFWHLSGHPISVKEVPGDPSSRDIFCPREPSCIEPHGRNWHYGRDDTCNYQSVDTTLPNNGSLTSPAISIPPDSLFTRLEFGSARRVDECGTRFAPQDNEDRTWIDVLSGTGFGMATRIFDMGCISGEATTRSWRAFPTQDTWLEAPSIDLSAFGGQAIKLRYSFDTVTAINNEGRIFPFAFGWMVDNIRVVGHLTCPNVARCLDADKDGYWDRACEPSTSGGGGDCNDSNPAIHPEHPETCKNGVDDDCDGLIDEGCKGGR